MALVSGTETISAGGVDSGAWIFGGLQDVYGVASGTIVSVGSQVLETGGTASGATIKSSPAARVSRTSRAAAWRCPPP
jgi:autotransporter passenger strand-loop-strand repeat protein